MGYHDNPWLSSAFQNTSNPNQDYQSYLEGLGMDVDPSKVGKFFGGITEDYQQDVGMARAGLDQTMGQGRMMGQEAMFGLGGGQGISSGLGGGFGRQGYGMMQGIGGINKQYGQTLSSGLLGYTGDLQSAQRGMESSFRDVATGLLGRDSEGISYDGSSGGGTTTPPPNNWNPPENPTQGQSYYYDGQTYMWSDVTGQWSTAGGAIAMCFVAGTTITMSDEGFKSIENVDIGDIVKSWNEESGKIEDKKVTRLIRPLHDDIVKLKFGGIETSTTFDHPYYVKGKGWSSYKPEWTMDRYDIGDIAQIKEGDTCYKYEDGELRNIKLDNIEENLGRVQTYIFKVESNKTFFANSILVHNK